MDMIKCENASFEYPSIAGEEGADEARAALRGVSVGIKQGEFVAVLGHNGSGKSTLAKLFNALLLPVEGKVWVCGMDTSAQENIWDVRRNAGMVFQNPDNQIIATVVEEDVAFGCENLGLPPEEIRRRVDAALETVHMAEFAAHPPHYLSGGQKQRVAIAGILAMRPSCIVLDEPTAMLDPSGRKEVLDTVLRLNREEGMTVVLITHYMDEAALADRVIVMEEGEIVMDGTPRSVFRQVERLKALGLDVPQVTEICNGLKRLGVPIDDGVITIDEMVGAVCRMLGQE